MAAHRTPPHLLRRAGLGVAMGALLAGMVSAQPTAPPAPIVTEAPPVLTPAGPAAEEAPPATVAPPVPIAAPRRPAGATSTARADNAGKPAPNDRPITAAPSIKLMVELAWDSNATPTAMQAIEGRITVHRPY